MKTIAICALAFLMPLAGYTADEKHECENILGEHKGDRSHRIIFSGRDEDVQDKLEAYAAKLFDKGGVAEKLGLSSAHQIIQFLSGSELSAVTANGRMPVGHWSEGAKIVKGGGGGILEMVISGGMVRHSIYRDDLNWKQQLSILNHVLGHVHFGVHTVYRQSRTSENNQAAYEFDAMLEKLKSEYDREEVSEWYQYLLSLEWMQDMTGGSYNTIADFRLNPNQKRPRGSRGPLPNPSVPTANVIQAFIANLPSQTPAWKRTMAESYFQMVAYISGAINTKIMNEGFATLMQELLPSHTGMNSFDHFGEYCCLISGVTERSLSNPYWLGLEGWRNIRKRFNKRPEIKDLPLLEKDRRFIAYATKEIIQKMDDKMFLREGLDDSWIAQQRLVLTRRLKNSEWHPGLPPPPPNQFKDPHQFEVVTRDPKRVRESIIMNVKGFEFQLPRPVLTNLAADGSGMIHLEISDAAGKNLGLKKRSMIQSQVVMARVMQAPISLESTFVSVTDAAGGPIAPWALRWWLSFSSIDELIRDGQIKMVRDRYRTVVHPNGEVEAYRVLRNGDAGLKNLKVDHFDRADDSGVEVKLLEDKELSEKFSRYAEEFQEDLDLGNSPYMELKRQSTAQRLEKAVASVANGVPPGLLVKVPTVPHAIEEFWNYANSRKMAALLRAMQKGRGLIQGKNKVSVKVFPDIPSFQFDRSTVRLYAGSLPMPVASHFAKITSQSINSWGLFSAGAMGEVGDKVSGDFPLDIDENGDDEGDPFWNEGDSNDGQGDGDEEDGEDDSDKKPGEGNQGGEGSEDPRYLDLDLDLYAELLAEYIELPNLRPLDGKSQDRKDVRGGWAYRRTGPKEMAKIARKAIGRGKAYFRSKGIDEKDPIKIIRKGFKLLDARDIVVKDFTPDPQPDVNAVVFVKMDLSGSFTLFVKRTKQMLFDMRALLQKKYKKVMFVYVGFDGEAIATEDPDEFFRMELGGGTNYATAFKKTVELFDKYPEAKWDRFSVLAGDFEDFTQPELAASLDGMRKGVRFMSGIRMAYSREPGGAEVETLYRQWAEEDPYVSFVDLAPDNEYTPLVLRQIFRNSNEE